jgi:hypothetical protein
MNKEIFKQKGSALILVIIAIVIIAIIVFGFGSWKGQVEQSKQIENKALNDLQKINDNLKKSNQEIVENLADTPTTINTADWQTFTNGEYNYSIKLPPNTVPFSKTEIPLSPAELKKFFEVYFGNSEEYLSVVVDVKDPLPISFDSKGNSIAGNYEYTSAKIIDIMKMDLRNYVQYVWELNFKQGNLREGSLQEITFNGHHGYKFSTVAGYVDESGGEYSSEKYNYIFIENKGLKYVLGFLDNNISEAAINTFEFKK